MNTPRTGVNTPRTDVNTPHPDDTARPPRRAPLEDSELAGVVQTNIRTLVGIRDQMARSATAQERIADAMTRFTGSLLFVYLHLVIVGGWILVNTGVLGIAPFDPFPFVMLAMVASVEAIFLSTFVLISQNRMARLSERRAELDLQINLLAEHEVTRLIHLTDAIARHLGVEAPEEGGLEELKEDVAPEQVLEEIVKVEKEVDKESSG